MTVDRYIHLFAGLFIMVSLALGVEASPLFVSPWALAFTAFVGVNLFQFGLTNFCPLAIILKKLGVPEGIAARLDAVIAQRPTTVLLLAGINDALVWGVPVADVVACVAGVREQLQAQRVRVVVLT